MSVFAFLAEATAASLMLRAEAGRLHWRADAPPAPDLLAKLREQKADLLDLLTEVDERAGILEFDGAVPREQATSRPSPKCWPASRLKVGPSLLLPQSDAADER